MDQALDYSESMDLDAANFETAFIMQQLLSFNDAYPWAPDGPTVVVESVPTNCESTPTSDLRTVGEKELWPYADVDAWRKGDEMSDILQPKKPPGNESLLETLDWWALQDFDDSLPTMPWEGWSLDQSLESTSVQTPRQWMMPHTQDSPGSSAESPESSGSDPSTRPSPRKRGRKRLERKPGEEEHDRHRHIEKKYRHKLASGLARLRARVPSLLEPDEEEPPAIKLGGLTTTRKRSKGTVITKAAEYIEHIEQRCEAAEERAEKAERVARQFRQGERRGTCMCAAMSAFLSDDVRA